MNTLELGRRPGSCPVLEGVAAVVTEGGEGVRRVDVSAPSCLLVVVNAVSGGAGDCWVR